MSQSRFVHIVDEVPDLTADDGRGPVLVVALQGFLDAGNASAEAIGCVTEDQSGRVVASFEVEEFYDYRARRPPLTFRQDRYTDYEAPRLIVRALSDAAGTPYLLLSGPEPDVRWEGFAQAVRRVVEHFDVRLVLSLGSIPMAVPHTRAVQLTNHATDQNLLVQENVWSGDIRVPASAQSVLELRLGEWGHDAMGFVAHIPHYVAQLDYPLASVALLTALADVTGLSWDLTALRSAGEERMAEISTQLEDSDEVREVVTALERQYDAFHAAREAGDSLLAPDQPLPSGDELGAHFEQFLAGLEDPAGGATEPPGED